MIIYLALDNDEPILSSDTEENLMKRLDNYMGVDLGHSKRIDVNKITNIHSNLLAIVTYKSKWNTKEFIDIFKIWGVEVK